MLETNLIKRESPKDKSLVKNQGILSEEQKKENNPVKAPQAFISAKQVKESPKEKPEGQEKVKGKGKPQMEQPLPSELQNLKERKTSMENVFNMARSLMEFKNKE
ncbi:hypothetical protein O181_032536 [Austropuccinia psidii MF-1]|uniref:Uncharacterized protein n=1 Tax=Austropuccinia psidii MF-1 TaxID=1389203 RepID=A0A9Q3H686_9BASI|nr:hypothetical protein [Austropuccinia psidii MF-1]